MWCEQVCVCPQCGHQIGWMFEPEDGALAGLERPSEEGFIAVIVNKAGDVKRMMMVKMCSKFTASLLTSQCSNR